MLVGLGSRAVNKPDRIASARRRWLFAIAGLAATTSLASSDAKAFEWVTIANSATPIPSTSKLFSSFNQPSVNDNCLVTFRARGKGSGIPPRGVYHVQMCERPRTIETLFSNDSLVPYPNNTDAEFTEFPAFSRISADSDLIASRGQSRPVWVYTPDGGDETRVGTAGVYVARGPGFTPTTGASQLGVVPEFSYFDVPGFPGTRFDQFPGAPSPFDRRFVAFKGNFTDPNTSSSRTGVYFRRAFQAFGQQDAQVRLIADTRTQIPGGTTTFGSTAPPSAADGSAVFVGLDDEDNPTDGGIYRSYRSSPRNLETLVAIGDRVRGTGGERFTRFGEGLSYDGKRVSFWGAWGDEVRNVRLHCPVDGNKDLIAACKKQCPDTDEIGNYCVEQVPVNQGIFVRRSAGKVKMIARAGVDGTFKDFLFWVFSGRPPTESNAALDSAEDEPEPPRWRSSAFAALSPRGTSASVVFKGIKKSDREGLYILRRLDLSVERLLLVGSRATKVDRDAPADARVTSVGVERDGYRKCRLTINAGFLDEATSESWAGIYIEKNACRG